jgi:cyclase
MRVRRPHASLAEIRKLTNKPVRTLINSHWHLDHGMGNEVYADSFPGLQIIATVTTRNFMKRMPPAFFVDESGVPQQRTRIDAAIRSGKRSDGTPLTDSIRRELEPTWPNSQRHGTRYPPWRSPTA